MNEEQLPPHLDQQVLDELYDAVGMAMAQIVDLFLTEFPQQIIEMQLALTNNDINKVILLAHSLKSSCANLGAMRLSGIAKDLEAIATNVTKDEIANSIVKLQTEFDQIRNIYTKYL